jgi:hypothetical protein
MYRGGGEEEKKMKKRKGGRGERGGIKRTKK